MKNLKFKNVVDKLIHETRAMVLLTTFLTFFLISLTLYHGLLVGKDVFSYYHVGYNFVEALLLSKIIVLGKMLKLGERYSEKSLYIPTLHKTVVFSIFVFIFSVSEHFVIGFLKGKHISLLWTEFASQGFNVIFGKLFIVFFVFIILFGFLELCRFVGEEKAFKLFFRRQKDVEPK